MNVRRMVCLVAIVVVLGTGLSTWRYLAHLQQAGTSAHMPAPVGSLGASIAKAVNAMPEGAIAIHVPLPVLDVGGEETVRVIVQDSVPVAVAGVLESQKLLAPGATGARIAVSQQMNVQLYGDPDRVKITPLQSAKAYVVFGPDHTIEWSWIVKPLVRGDAGLSAVVTAQLDPALVGPEKSRVRVATLDVPVQATTTLLSTIRDAIAQNWTWLWAAIVVPGADAGWAWYRRRREHETASVANA